MCRLVPVHGAADCRPAPVARGGWRLFRPCRSRLSGREAKIRLPGVYYSDPMAKHETDDAGQPATIDLVERAALHVLQYHLAETLRAAHKLLLIAAEEEAAADPAAEAIDAEVHYSTTAGVAGAPMEGQIRIGGRGLPVLPEDADPEEVDLCPDDLWIGVKLHKAAVS